MVGGGAYDAGLAGAGRAMRPALALGCRRLWWLGYLRGVWLAGIVLGTATVAASLLAGLLGPVAIAVYAIVLSVPVWIAWYWLVRRG